MRRMVEGARIICPLRLTSLATSPASGGGTAPSAPGMRIFVQSRRCGSRSEPRDVVPDFRYFYADERQDYTSPGRSTGAAHRFGPAADPAEGPVHLLRQIGRSGAGC